MSSGGTNRPDMVRNTRSGDVFFGGVGVDLARSMTCEQCGESIENGQRSRIVWEGDHTAKYHADDRDCKRWKFLLVIGSEP